LKLISIVRFACGTLDVGHPIHFPCNNRILRKIIDYPVNNGFFDMKFSMILVVILNSSQLH
jgi:hypothetical protein